MHMLHAHVHVAWTCMLLEGKICTCHSINPHISQETTLARKKSGYGANQIKSNNRDLVKVSACVTTAAEHATCLCPSLLMLLSQFVVLEELIYFAQMIIAKIRALPGNNRCADCGAADPEWLSVYLGILICIHCSGRHREMSVQYSRIRSLKLDQLKTHELLVSTSLSLVLPPSLTSSSSDCTLHGQ